MVTRNRLPWSALQVADFRQCGLSQNKARAIIANAQRFVAGTDGHNSDRFSRSLSRLDDVACRERLVTLAGIGPWSAEMLMIFALRRPDVWSQVTRRYGARCACGTI